MPELGPAYHVGIVVADLYRARIRLSERLGVSWGPVMHLDEVSYRDGAGADLVLPTTICYSAGDPSLELIEEVPGTIWVRNEHSNLHHLGFWSDRLDDDSDAAGAGGCPLQLCGRDLRPILMGGLGAPGAPMCLGHEMDGTVDWVGADVTRAQVGDRVVVHPGDDELGRIGSGGLQGGLTPLRLVTDADRGRLHRVPDELPLDVAAFAEQS